MEFSVFKLCLLLSEVSPFISGEALFAEPREAVAGRRGLHEARNVGQSDAGAAAEILGFERGAEARRAAAVDGHSPARLALARFPRLLGRVPPRALRFLFAVAFLAEQFWLRLDEAANDVCKLFEVKRL